MILMNVPFPTAGGDWRDAPSPGDAESPPGPCSGLGSPLTAMALMQSRYVAFCTQVNAILSCCVRSLRLLHFFSSGEDMVHHLMTDLGGAAKHTAVGKGKTIKQANEKKKKQEKIASEEKGTRGRETASLSPCSHSPG